MVWSDCEAVTVKTNAADLVQEFLPEGAADLLIALRWLNERPLPTDDMILKPAVERRFDAGSARQRPQAEARRAIGARADYVVLSVHDDRQTIDRNATPQQTISRAPTASASRKMFPVLNALLRRSSTKVISG